MLSNRVVEGIEAQKLSNFSHHIAVKWKRQNSDQLLAPSELLFPVRHAELAAATHRCLE